jgi:mRNA interferase YafQ
MQELKDVMRLLIEKRGPLPPQYLDHPLKGEWKDWRLPHPRRLAPDLPHQYNIRG